MIDLHTHSNVSDGSDTPAGVIDLAATAGCTAVALTDHDRLDGVEEARARAAQTGVGLVPGCEISCEYSPGTMHVLVYWVEPGGGPLQDELVSLQRAREDRNLVMAERLGIPYDEVLAEAGAVGAVGGDDGNAGDGDDGPDKGVGRPHFAAVLVRRGMASSIQDAFDRYLAKGQPAYVDKRRLGPAEALALARSSGGVPVLAHPLSLGLPPAELEMTVAELASLGLCGLEAIYGRYTPEERDGLADLARRHDLVVTGGSDHHGSYKPDLTVGTGRGDLDVPDTVLVDLEARRP